MVRRCSMPLNGWNEADLRTALVRLAIYDVSSHEVIVLENHTNEEGDVEQSPKVRRSEP